MHKIIRAKSGTPALLLTFCRSTFSAARLGCGRTHLVLLAALGLKASRRRIAAAFLAVTAALLAMPVQAQAQGVCDRTGQVRDAIVAAAPVSACGDVTEEHLAAIGSLDLARKGISVLKTGDFSGLTSLTGLSFVQNQLRTLPAGVFAGGSFDTLDLSGNGLRTLPAGVFADLADLTNPRSLDLAENKLVTLPAARTDGRSVFPDAPPRECLHGHLRHPTQTFAQLSGLRPVVQYSTSQRPVLTLEPALILTLEVIRRSPLIVHKGNSG